MKNTFKKRRFSAVLIILILLACFAALIPYGSGVETSRAYTVDDNYYFKRIDVDITVNRDKTFDICETLKVGFHESNLNTGIIRDIQRLSKTTRVVDGKKQAGRKYFAGLENVEVTLDGGEAKVTRSLYGDFHSVKMQTPNGYISAGEHVFVLKYKYDMSDDKARGYDDFTFDVLGYAMAYTGVFTAKITFPEDTDLSNVTFRTNDKQTWTPDTSNWEYARVEGNKISLFALPQAAEKGYTVQVILPNGYFSQKLTFYPYYIIFAVMAVLGIAAVTAFVILNRTNLKTFAPVEYLPPEDMTVMQISAVWHKGARYKDVGAVVLHWAAKGLVSIQADGKRDFKIIPNKDMSADKFTKLLNKLPYAEKELFDAFLLFAGRYETFSTKEFKKRKSIFKREVYEKTEKIVDRADEAKPSLISRDAVKRIVPFAALIPTLAILLYFAILEDMGFFIVFFLFMFAGTYIGTEFNLRKVILWLLWPLVFYGVIYAVFVQFSIPLYDYAYLLIIAPVWWAVGLFVLPYFVDGIRGKKLKEDYRRLYGFRNYLLLTELESLRLVFNENPDFFAEILPYCYVLGIYKKVQKRFASLGIEVPPYIKDGVSPYDIGHCISHSCHNSSVSFDCTGGSSGGGGGGGGGGSSGGGGGGGGSRGC